MIPKKIFQTFETTHLPAGMFQATQTWQIKNPEYEYKLFNAQERFEFIQQHFGKEVLKAYTTLVPGAFKADLFRLCVLHVYGGVYVDADMLCENSLDRLFDLVGPDTDFIISRDDPMAIKWLANGFMASRPRHPFVLQAIDRIVENTRNLEERFYLDYSGPGLLGKAVNFCLQRDIETDYELGVQEISGFKFCLLKHDFTRQKMSLGSLDVTTTEYPTYRQEMSMLGNKPFFDYVQNKRVFSKVPKVILYTSLDELDVNEYMIESFKKHNPDFEFKYFNQQAVDNWFANSIYNDAYLKLTERGEKTDFFRYCYLWEHGGFYTDTDTFCNQPIRNWLTYQDFVVGYECNNDLPFDFFKGIGQEQNGKMVSIANWTIAAKPKHPILSKVINDIIDNPKPGDVLKNTGPGRFTKHVLNYFGDEMVKGDSQILPINGFGSNQSHSGAYKSNKPFEVTREDVFITHMFAGTWRSQATTKKVETYKREPHPAVAHNLTIWKDGDQLKGVSRYDFNQERTKFMEVIGDLRELKYFEFDENLKITKEEIKPISGYSALSRFEDFRQFTYKSKNYFSVAYIDDKFNTNMGLLDEDFNFLGEIKLDRVNRMSWLVGPEINFEKNWLFFEYRDQLYLIYSTTPNLIIYKCGDFNNLQFERFYEEETQSKSPIPQSEYYFTAKVTTGGSCAPLQIGDKLVYLIHTKIYNERKYNHWAVVLNSDLSFHSINPTPFISKNVGMMMFINSMIESGDELLISGGIEDNQNFIWPISKSRLERFIR